MSEKLQGFEEYTPSRLEWLVVMLNSMVNYVNVSPEGSRAVYAYILGRDGNTIIMHMKYFADLPPETRERIRREWEKIGNHYSKKLQMGFMA